MDNDSKTESGDIAADQSDLSKICGKLVVLAITQEDERQAFTDLLAEINLRVKYAASAAEVMQLLEDHTAHLLVLDMQLPDIHAWKMIRKLREIEHLRDLPVMVITDEASFGMTVAKVDYLTRPVSIARLRHSVWTALTQRTEDGGITPRDQG